MYFLNVEILSGKNCLVKAAAIRAVAFCLDDIEYFIAIIALGKPGNHFKNEFCVLELGILDNNRIEFLNIFRNNKRKLTNFADDLANTLDIIILRIVKNRLAHASDYSDFVHITSYT